MGERMQYEKPKKPKEKEKKDKESSLGLKFQPMVQDKTAVYSDYSKKYQEKKPKEKKDKERYFGLIRPQPMVQDKTAVYSDYSKKYQEKKPKEKKDKERYFGLKSKSVPQGKTAVVSQKTQPAEVKAKKRTRKKGPTPTEVERVRKASDEELLARAGVPKENVFQSIYGESLSGKDLMLTVVAYFDTLNKVYKNIGLNESTHTFRKYGWVGGSRGAQRGEDVARVRFILRYMAELFRTDDFIKYLENRYGKNSKVMRTALEFEREAKGLDWNNVRNDEQLYKAIKAWQTFLNAWLKTESKRVEVPKRRGRGKEELAEISVDGGYGIETHTATSLFINLVKSYMESTTIVEGIKEEEEVEKRYEPSPTLPEEEEVTREEGEEKEVGYSQESSVVVFEISEFKHNAEEMRRHRETEDILNNILAENGLPERKDLAKKLISNKDDFSIKIEGEDGKYVEWDQVYKKDDTYINFKRWNVWEWIGDKNITNERATLHNILQKAARDKRGVILTFPEGTEIHLTPESYDEQSGKFSFKVTVEKAKPTEEEESTMMTEGGIEVEALPITGTSNIEESIPTTNAEAEEAAAPIEGEAEAVKTEKVEERPKEESAKATESEKKEERKKEEGGGGEILSEDL